MGKLRAFFHFLQFHFPNSIFYFPITNFVYLNMRLRFAIITSCILLLFGGCKKQRIVRRYTGNFVFTNYYVSSDINGNNQDTTIVSHGQIEMYTGAAVSQENAKNPVFLQIKFNGGSVVVEVNKDGSFVTDTKLHGETSGGFSDNDNLHFVDTDGGMGSTYTSDVTGVRE